MMKDKKSQIELQFNWIFVVIAGVVFLLFFISIISSQSKSSDEKISVSLIKHFQTIMDSTVQKSGTFKEYNFPSVFEMEFECKTNENLYFYTLESRKVTDVKYEIIFAPKNLSGRNVYTWTQQWDLPNEQGFSVGNFLYITNKLQGYIFQNSSSDNFKLLYETFPQNTSIHISYNQENFKSRNYNSYTIILLNDSNNINVNSFINSYSDTDIVKHIVITPDDNKKVFEKGKILFCKKNLDSCRESFYLGRASLYGAIFSGDREYYECNMLKAFNKLKLTLTLQYYWLKDINSSLSRNICKQSLGLIGTTNAPYKLLTNLVDPENKLTSPNSPLIKDPIINIDDIYENINKIHNINQGLDEVEDCVQLY